MKIIKYMLITLFASLSFGCSSNDPIQTTANLAGTSWQLLTLNDANPVDGNPATLTFNETAVSGNTGCNQYGGSYRVDGTAITIGKGEDGSSGNLFSTKKLCSMPEGLMQQEQQYLQLLGASTQYTLENNTLTLSSENGSLVYQQAP
jgi:heat shock protein HslJ